MWKLSATFGKGLHDALHVHHHRLDGAGQDNQFLVQEVAGAGDTLAHHHLVGGADAGQADAGSALWAYSISSGSCTAATIISLSVGSWPWTRMLTSSVLRTPRLTWLTRGWACRIEYR